MTTEPDILRNMPPPGGVTGAFPGIAINDYHGDKLRVSKSGLDRIARSPLIFYALTLDPDRPPEEEKKGQLEGNLLHTAFLEPDTFDSRYAVLPENAPRKPTKAQWEAKKPSPDSVAAMDWWSEWGEQQAGKTTIDEALRDAALSQASSLRRIGQLRDVMAKGEPEVSVYWKDPKTGVACRCRPDWVHRVAPKKVILVDAKTCGDASDNGFARQVHRKRYHVQAAFYSDGYEQATGDEVVGFIFAAVEVEWPYAASALMLDDKSMEQGRREYEADLRVYAECMRTKTWPSFSPDGTIRQIGLPHYAFTE